MNLLVGVASSCILCRTENRYANRTPRLSRTFSVETPCGIEDVTFYESENQYIKIIIALIFSYENADNIIFIAPIFNVRLFNRTNL